MSRGAKALLRSFFAPLRNWGAASAASRAAKATSAASDHALPGSARNATRAATQAPNSQPIALAWCA
jgi:hypothetical protein